MDRVYVVFGETGEFDDVQGWPVRAFAREADADACCNRCNAYARGIPHPYGGYKSDRVAREAYCASNPDDPCMMSYDVITTYTVHTVPFSA